MLKCISETAISPHTYFDRGTMDNDVNLQKLVSVITSFITSFITSIDNAAVPFISYAEVTLRNIQTENQVTDY